MKSIWLAVVLVALLILAACGRSESAEANAGVAIPTAVPRMTPGSAVGSAASDGAVAARPTPTETAIEAEAEEVGAEEAAVPEPEPTATATTRAIPTEEPTVVATSEQAAAAPAAGENEAAAAITETVELTNSAASAEMEPVTTDISGTLEAADAEVITDSAVLTEAIALDASSALSDTADITETVDATVATEVLEIKMNDLYFGESMDNIVNPPVWTVTSGAEVTLNLENMGSVDHNWAVVQAGIEVPVPFDAAQNSDMILYDPGIVTGGESKTVTFSAPIPGVYTVICTVPGHYPVMQGRLEVK